MGSNTGNENKGAIVFHQTQTPSGIGYFIIKPTDVGLEMMLSTLLTARAKGITITVSYVKGTAKIPGTNNVEAFPESIKLN
jgi:hypothetical protein